MSSINAPVPVTPSSGMKTRGGGATPNSTIHLSDPATKAISAASKSTYSGAMSKFTSSDDRSQDTIGLDNRKRQSQTAEKDKDTSQPPKKRKIGKNNGTGEDNKNDYYCWQCHREGSVICCELCPRVFHRKCLGIARDLPDNWVCLECEKTMVAECMDTRSKAMSMITTDQLCQLLRFALNRMMFTGTEPFQKPVEQSVVPTYLDYVFYPLDLRQLERNIKRKKYGSTEAFLADVKWIQHNCIIFNGPQHKLSAVARSIIKICKHEMNEIEICPDCYLNSCVKQNDVWFCEPCRTPHTVVWAKLKGYPFWPAKALREADGQVDVRFFGAHDRSWVPVSQVFLLSKDSPTPIRNKRSGFDNAIEELELHITKIREKFGSFEYAQFRTPYDRCDVYLHNRIKLNQKPHKDKSPTKVAKSSCPASMKKGDTKQRDSVVMKKAASALKMKYNSIITTRRAAAKAVDKSTSIVADKLNVFELSEPIKTDLIDGFNISSQSVKIAIPKLKNFDIVSRVEKTLSQLDVDKVAYGSESDGHKDNREPSCDISNDVVASLVDNVNATVKSCQEGALDKPGELDGTLESKTSDKQLLNGFNSSLASEETASSCPKITKSYSDAVKSGLHCESEDKKETCFAPGKSSKTPKYQLTLQKTIESCKAKLRLSDEDVENAIADDYDEKMDLSDSEVFNCSDSSTKSKRSSSYGIDELKEDGNGSNEEIDQKPSESEKDIDEPGQGKSVLESELGSVVSKCEGREVEKEFVSISQSTCDKEPQAAESVPVMDTRHVQHVNSLKSESIDLNYSMDSETDSIFSRTLGNDGKNVSKSSVHNAGGISAQSEASRIDEAVRNSNKVVHKNRARLHDNTPDSPPVCSLPQPATNVGSVAASSLTKSSTRSRLPELMDQESDSSQDNLIIDTDASADLPNGGTTKKAGSDSSSLATMKSPIITTCSERINEEKAGNTPDVASLKCEGSASRQVGVAKSQPPASSARSKPSFPKTAATTTAGDNLPFVVKISFASQPELLTTSSIKLVNVVSSVTAIAPKVPLKPKLSLLAPISSTTVVPCRENPISPTYVVPPETATSIVVSPKMTKNNRERRSHDRDPPSNVSIDTKKYQDRMVQFMSDMIKEVCDDVSKQNMYQMSVDELHKQIDELKAQHQLEISEIRHNLEVNLNEMRQLWEQEKASLKEELAAKFNEEKAKAILSVKKKQWCVNCHKEAIFYCCWNTSYCDYPCQISHWPEHMKHCTQRSQQSESSATPAPDTQPAVDTSEISVVVPPQASNLPWTNQAMSSPPNNFPQTALSSTLQTGLDNATGARMLPPTTSHPIHYLSQMTPRQPLSQFNTNPKTSIIPRHVLMYPIRSPQGHHQPLGSLQPQRVMTMPPIGTPPNRAPAVMQQFNIPPTFL